MSAIQIWSVYLTWDIIFASIAPKDIQFFPYQPQIFARQFGHCQLPSVTIYRKKTHRYQIQGDESLIPKVIEKGTPKVKLQFQPSSFVPKIILRDFHLWWKKCYSQRLISILSSLEKLIKTCCSVQDTSKKIKGKYELTLEIKNFKNFYCICYHPTRPIVSFQEAIFALREKNRKKLIKW